MNAIISPSKANGTVKAPPSKSMVHRYLIGASLADGESIVHDVELSQDILATLDCIRAMGAKAEFDNGTVYVKGNGGPKNLDSVLFPCRESGSTLRFFIPLAMISDNEMTFTGSQVLMTRPLSVYEDIINEQQLFFERIQGGIKVRGPLKSGKYICKGNISSQFITGLLFTLPLLSGDSVLELVPPVDSRSYINMTLSALKDYGIKIDMPDENTFIIKGNQTYIPGEHFVEGDYSNAAFFEALNTLGGNVLINGLRDDSLQGDKIYQKHFKSLCQGYTHIDISDCPDLGPILFVVAATHKGGEFTGTRRLKIKESDRGSVMCQELSYFGVKTLMEEDRIVIYESTLKKPDLVCDGHNDHRIVMSLATLMTLTGGKIEGIGAVRKSLPTYFDIIKNLGIEVITDGMDK